jgi:hypothetical protein
LLATIGFEIAAPRGAGMRTEIRMRERQTA